MLPTFYQKQHFSVRGSVRHTQFQGDFGKFSQKSSSFKTFFLENCTGFYSTGSTKAKNRSNRAYIFPRIWPGNSKFPQLAYDWV